MPIKVVWSSKSPNSTQAIPGEIQMSPMEANPNIVCFFFYLVKKLCLIGHAAVSGPLWEW